ncbi:MAG: phosphosulfolactate synthase [Desulfobacter sp.]|nr:phosphosulfolactate synthase [Desulfobacter sp.]
MKQANNLGRTLELPERQTKPRQSGLTAITDVGISNGEMENILSHYGKFVDMAKIGIGTAYIEPFLKEKITLFKDRKIPVYFGGTLFEKYFSQDRLADYIDFLHANGISWVEISSGIIDIEMSRIISLIKTLKQEFTVLVEVGKKEASADFSDEDWIPSIQQALDAGCAYVVLEGRNTADAGIYSSDGLLNKALIREMKKEVDADKLIIEAATAKSQSQIINIFGPNVNLGNIFARDLLLLESQRLGLREDTFYVT